MAMAYPKRGVFEDDYGDESESSGDAEEKDELPPDFVAAACEAFPEMEDDPGRLQAFYDAIEACKGGDGGGMDVLIGFGKPKKGKR